MKKWFLLALWMSVPYLFANATQAPPVVLLEDDDEEEIVISQPAKTAATVTTTVTTTAKPSTLADDDEDDLAPQQVNNKAKAEAEAKAKAEAEAKAKAEAEAKAKAEAEAKAKAEAEAKAKAEAEAKAKAEAEAKAEQERLAAEKAEQERLAAEKAEQERLAAEKAEQERLAAEKAEQERLAAEKAEQERIAAEKAEQERITAEKAEQERIAAEKAEQERIAAEKAEQERLAAEAKAKAEAEAKASVPMAKPKAAPSQLGGSTPFGDAAPLVAPAVIATSSEQPHQQSAKNQQPEEPAKSTSRSSISQRYFKHSGHTTLTVLSIGYSTYFLVGQPAGVPSARDAFKRHMLNFQLFEFRVGYVGLQLFDFEVGLNTVYNNPTNSADYRPLHYRGGPNPTDLADADARTMWFAYKPAIKGFIPCTKWLAVELFGGIEMDLTGLWSKILPNWYTDPNIPVQNYFFAIHCGAGLMFTGSPVLPLELKAEYRHPLSQVGARTANTVLVPQGIYLTLQLNLTKTLK